MEKVKEILVVAQTPPPYGGQAIMIDYMLKGNFKKIKFYHVRMNFSREMNERGKISFYKLAHSISIILKVYKFKFKHRIDTLYYPPSNSPKISIYRDVFLLFFTRFLFKETIFQFHAAGISEELPKMKAWEHKFFYQILKSPSLAITSSIYNPDDGNFLKARRTLILPLGIPDNNPNPTEKKANNGELKILFIGLMNSTKGEGYLLDALKQITDKGYNCKLLLAGKFETEEYEEMFFQKVKLFNLVNRVDYRGVVTGESKKNLYLESDILCFPSHFSSESFGLVILEAMQFQLPVIATKWRGLQSLIDEGGNGLLVDIANSTQIANCLEYFLKYPNKLIEFGKVGRKKYMESYTLDKYLEKLETAFLNV
jgi:glycosyltransferase involved in cell wall biosynthesis